MPRNFGHLGGSTRTFAETIAWHLLQTHGESHLSGPCFMPTPMVRQPHWRRASRRKPVNARGGRGAWTGAARGRLYYNRVQKRALPNKDLRRVATLCRIPRNHRFAAEKRWFWLFSRCS